MNIKRIVELCQLMTGDLKTQRAVKKGPILNELGIGPKLTRDATDDSIREKLRIRLTEFAVSKGILVADKPLPKCGVWPNKVLLEINDTGMLIVPKGEGLKGTTHINPLGNRVFHDLLLKS